MLPTSTVIVSRLTMQTDNGKAAITFSNLIKHFVQLEIDCIDNANIKEVNLDKKGVRINKIGKNRFELNFLQKIWNL